MYTVTDCGHSFKLHFKWNVRPVVTLKALHGLRWLLSQPHGLSWLFIQTHHMRNCFMLRMLSHFKSFLHLHFLMLTLSEVTFLQTFAITFKLFNVFFCVLTSPALSLTPVPQKLISVMWVFLYLLRVVFWNVAL